jgi:hypothetical protein
MFVLIKPENKEDHDDILKAIVELAHADVKDVNALVNPHRYWLIAKHPVYGVMGGMSLRPTPTDDKVTYCVDHSVHSNDRIVHLQRTQQNDVFARLSTSLHGGWMGTHLFFYLSDEIMDEMTDDALANCMRFFYAELYRALLDISFALDIPYFCLVSSPDEHAGATLIGQLPLEEAQPFVADGEEYVLSFLPIGRHSNELFYKSCTLKALKTHHPSYTLN